MTEQQKKAEQLLRLHHDPQLLILPNVWDVLGARLVTSENYPAVATASASVAFSHGKEDNEKVPFPQLLSLFKSICACTTLPVTTDIEKGYAQNLNDLKSNIQNLIKTGVVGLNIEDSLYDENGLVSIEKQCEKIQLIRNVATKAGVPLVINARTDVFLLKAYADNRKEEAITRAKQYRDAGADCFYPILCTNQELLEINQEIGMPVNVLAQQTTLTVNELQASKIARLSLGPGLLKAALMQMQKVIRGLKQGRDFNSIQGTDLISSQEIARILGY